MDYTRYDLLGKAHWMAMYDLEQVLTKCTIVETQIMCCEDFMRAVFYDGQIRNGLINRDMYEDSRAIFDHEPWIKMKAVYDFSLTKWFRSFACILPNTKNRVINDYVPVLVANWKHACELGCLRSYFDTNDIFEICVGQDLNKRYKYSGDYYDFLSSTYSFEDIMGMYVSWMKLNQRTMGAQKSGYASPLDFVKYFETQMSQYQDIIRSSGFEGRFFIPGDGPGTASMAAYRERKNYVSYEPNGIGSVAVGLKLISSVEKPHVNEDDCVLLFNVCDEFDVSDYNSFKYVIAVSASCGFGLLDFRAMIRCEGGRGHVYSTFPFKKELVTFPRDTTNFGMYLNKSVNPLDRKSEEMCYSERLVVDPAGVDITFDYGVDAMNMYTREHPRDKRAKVGALKEWKGKYFKYVVDGQVVLFSEGIKRYSARKYKAVGFVTKYAVLNGLVYVRSARPEKIRGIINDAGQRRLIYFVKTINTGKGLMGVYRNTESVFFDASKSEDYVAHAIELCDSGGLE